MTGCDPAAGSSCCGCDGAADQCRTMKDLKSLDLRQLSTQKTDDARLGAEWSTQQPCVPQLDGSFVRWVLQMQWRSVPPQDIDSAHERSSFVPSLVKRNAPAAGAAIVSAAGARASSSRHARCSRVLRARCTSTQVHAYSCTRHPARGIHTNVRGWCIGGPQPRLHTVVEGIEKERGTSRPVGLGGAGLGGETRRRGEGR